MFETPDLSVERLRAVAGRPHDLVHGVEQRHATISIRVPAAGGAPKRIAEGGAISAARPGSGFVVFSKSSLTSPPEIFASRGDGGGRASALTRENAKLVAEDVAIHAAREPDRDGRGRRDRCSTG